jgi:hypothetical protein
LGGAFPWQSVDAIRKGDDPKLISAAEWLMRRNNVEIVLRELGNGPSAFRIRSPQGVELQRIKAGTNSHPTSKGEPRTLEFKEDLWVSVGPIERRIYDQFATEIKNTVDGKPFPPLAHTNTLAESLRNNPERAISGIDISQAFQLCNWLSVKEGMTPAYVHEGKQSHFEGGQSQEYDKWKRDPDATGYRLPTVDEFKYLAYGGVEAGSPWEIVAKLEESKSGYRMEGFAEHPRLARDIFSNRFGLHCFELDSDYWLESETLLPAKRGLSVNGFYDPSWVPPGPDPMTTMFVVRK